MKLQGQSDAEVDLGPTEQTACGFILTVQIWKPLLTLSLWDQNTSLNGKI